MDRKFLKSVATLTLVSLAIVAVTLIAKLKYYNWSLWIIPLFFASLIIVLAKFLESKLENKFFATNYTQATTFKLFIIVAFILLFKLFLDKKDWINFIAYTVINYIAYSALEIKYFLKKLNTNGKE